MPLLGAQSAKGLAVNQDLRDISKWCAKNSPVINHKKTKLVVLAQHNLLRGYLISPYPCWAKLFYQCQLLRISRYTLINIYLPYQLVQMGRIKHLLDRKTLLLLINSFIFSKLFYCSSVWGNTSKRNLHKLQLVQNFAARVVLGLKKFDHISQGRRSLKWLDVTEKVLFNDLVLVFKCVNGLAPDYLGKYFIKRSAVHNKNTRGCNNFVVPRCRLSMGQRAFYFRGPKEWNGLPDNIRNTKDIDSFKRRLFNRIFHTK